MLRWYIVLTFTIFCLIVGGKFVLYAQSPSTDKQILSLDKVIEVDGAASSGAWSGDGNKLLVSLPFFSRNKQFGYSQLVDIETGEKEAPVRGLNSGLGHFYWSPDGKYIAAINHGNLRVMDYPGFQEVGKLGEKDRPCKFLSEYGAGFTSDGKAIWIACDVQIRKKPRGTNYLTAIKVSIPGLAISKKFMAPIPRENVSWLLGRSYVSAQGQDVILNRIIDTRVEYKGAPNKKKQDYFASYALEAGKINFPAFRIEELGIKGVPFHKTAYSTHQGQFAAAMGDYDVISRKTITRSVTLVTVDLSSIKPAATFEAYKSIEAISIGALNFSRSGELLIGVVTKANSKKKLRKRTTVAAWDAKDLTLLTEIETASLRWMELSPDGRRLAGIAGKKIYFFNVAD